MTAFKRSRTLEQTLASWANMLPAMNRAERTTMFRGLRSAAPEVVVAATYRVAERVLDARAWQALTSSLETTGASPFRAATEPEALRA
jgi:hypothetical protein